MLLILVPPLQFSSFLLCVLLSFCYIFIYLLVLFFFFWYSFRQSSSFSFCPAFRFFASYSQFILSCFFSPLFFFRPFFPSSSIPFSSYSLSLFSFSSVTSFSFYPSSSVSYPLVLTLSHWLHILPLLLFPLPLFSLLSPLLLYCPSSIPSIEPFLILFLLPHPLLLLFSLFLFFPFRPSSTSISSDITTLRSIFADS